MTPEQLHHMELAAFRVASAARALSELANLSGLVLTVETKPAQPLAMGNYTITVDVRPSHEAYRELS